MSTPLVEKLAKETNQSVTQVERQWERAKALADNRFTSKSSDYYEFAVQVLRNTLSVNQVPTSDYVNLGDNYTESTSDSKVKLGGIVLARRTSSPRSPSSQTSDNEGTRWDRQTIEYQRNYIADHPNSGRRVTSTRRGGESTRRRGPTSNRRQRTETERPEADLDHSLVSELLPEALPQGEAPQAEALPEDTPAPRQTLEPSTLNNITHVGRGLIHQAISHGVKKLKHIVHSNKQTFKGGLKALQKFSGGEQLSPEDKVHLLAMTVIVVGVVLASAVAFGPMLPYAGSIAHLYIEHLQKKRSERDDGEYDDDYEPPVIDDPELSSFTPQEQQNIQQVGHDFGDFAMNGNESLLNEARSLQNRGH